MPAPARRGQRPGPSDEDVLVGAAAADHDQVALPIPAPPVVAARTLERPRLTALLEAATARPVTVVASPPGYGRTTALAAWAATSSRPCAWLSLDARDDDPQRLVRRLRAALDTLAHAARRAPDPDPTRDPTRRRRSTNGVLVLDDLHVVRSRAGRDLLRAVAVSGPPGLSVVLSMRAEPSLPDLGVLLDTVVLGRRTGPSDGRLRLLVDGGAGTSASDRALAAHRPDAVGRATIVVGPDDLAFRPDESAALLRRAGAPELDDRRLAAADDVAGGWPVAVALVADALAGAPGWRTVAESLDVASAAIAERVAADVLGPVDPALRTFLLRTSFLPRLDGARCAVVLEDPEAPELLRRARAAGLLVRGDDRGDRHVGPFRAALRALLHRESPDEVATLHRRASAWEERTGEVGAAVAHASAAGDRERAAVLTAAHVAACGGPPGHGTTASALLPQPWSGRRGTAGLGAAGHGRPTPAVTSPWSGDLAAAILAGRRAVDDDGEGDATVRSVAEATLGQALWLAGDDAATRALLETRIGTMLHPAPRSWALATLALAVAAEDAPRAVHLGRHAARLARRTDAHWLDRVLAHQALADALRADGRLDEARVALGTASALTSAAPGSAHHALTLVLTAELAAADGDRRTAEDAARAARSTGARTPPALTDRLAALDLAATPARP